MNTHGDKLFVGVENVKGRFFIDVAPVHEIEHPYRSCNRAWHIHVLPGKALVIGWWKKRHDEETNLMKAIGGRVHVEESSEDDNASQSRLLKNKTQTKVDEFS